MSESEYEYDSDEVEIAACLFLLMNEEQEEEMEKRKRKRKCWVKPWIDKRVCQKQYDVSTDLLPQLRSEDPECFKNFLRMTADDFDYLYLKVRPFIEKQDTVMRQAIPASTRLALTVRYLATGDSYHSLMYLFRIPVCTISRIISEVVQVIYAVLKDEFLKLPTCPQEWEEVAAQFLELWNFPNCIGAVDGKHVKIKPPPNSGSLYYNYKQFHSIVLMAVADASYKFLYINVGQPGRNADGGVFSNCSFGQKLKDNNLNLPDDIPLPNRATPVPYCIVADDAFPLHRNIMKPFAWRNQTRSERIFNYRLSRARRVIENAFSILTARFRVLRSAVELNPKTVISVVCTICALHNFLLSRSGKLYAPKKFADYVDEEGNIIPGEWRELEVELEPLRNLPRRGDIGKPIRDEFAEYFSNEGAVPWQNQCI